MRFLLLTWTIFIFILTCTKDVYLLLKGEIEFVIVESPNWLELLTLYPLSDISKVEFVGHFFMFFILTGLLIEVLKRLCNAAVIAFLYGVLTELLQPFFGRGAEGIDLLANTVGIIAFVVLYGLVKSSFKMKLERESELENRHARTPF